MADDTIYALSSGRPPAAIAVVRISGPGAAAAGQALARSLPPPRRAARRRLYDKNGVLLDDALAIFFDGPATATGEDLVELHLHGGRAVVAAVEQALAAMPALRLAEPGEFTRRALANGRIDLAQAEGLADLLEAETEAARRAALAMSGGAVSQAAAGWLSEASAIAALVEASIDFSDDGDVLPVDDDEIASRLVALSHNIAMVSARPSTERLRSGVTIALAGPRNAGKSSLFNKLIGRDAAIVSDVAGTTRDAIESPVSRAGAPYLFVDTAGLTHETHDPIEAVGIERAKTIAATADIILWLGEPVDCPSGAILIHPRSREPGRITAPSNAIATDVDDPASVDMLWREIAERAKSHLSSHHTHLNKRQANLAIMAKQNLVAAANEQDSLLRAELLRMARRDLAAITGIDATEAMLDALFARFCIGK